MLVLYQILSSALVLLPKQTKSDLWILPSAWFMCTSRKLSPHWIYRSMAQQCLQIVDHIWTSAYQKKEGQLYIRIIARAENACDPGCCHTGRGHKGVCGLHAWTTYNFSSCRTTSQPESCPLHILETDWYLGQCPHPGVATRNTLQTTIQGVYLV